MKYKKVRTIEIDGRRETFTTVPKIDKILDQLVEKGALDLGTRFLPILGVCSKCKRKNMYADFYDGEGLFVERMEVCLDCFKSFQRREESG